jgi:hypothetical protein
VGIAAPAFDTLVEDVPAADEEGDETVDFELLPAAEEEEEEDGEDESSPVACVSSAADEVVVSVIGRKGGEVIVPSSGSTVVEVVESDAAADAEDSSEDEEEAAATTGTEVDEATAPKPGRKSGEYVAVPSYCAQPGTVVLGGARPPPQSRNEQISPESGTYQIRLAPP